MKLLAYFIRHTNHTIGRCLAWLVILMALLTVGLVLVRGLLGAGSIAAQELVTYMHASLFLLCMAYTLNEDGHVRVDVFYRRLQTHQQAWVNALGGVLFLLPFACFIVIVSWDYALRAWEIREASADPGGLPAVFLLKTLLPLSGILLALQAGGGVVADLCTVSFRDEGESTDKPHH